jgi:hypothetical protein
MKGPDLTPFGRLRAADPARDTGDAVDRHELLATIVAQPVGPLAPAQRRTRPVRRRLVAVAASVVVVGAGIAATATFLGDPTPTAQAKVFAQAARNLADQPSLVPGPGQYYYRRSEGVGIAGTISRRSHTSRSVRFINERWIARDGSGRFVNRSSDAATGKFIEVFRQSFRPQESKINFGTTALTIPQVQKLPTDPAALTARIESAFSHDNGQTWVSQEVELVVSLLRDAPVSPELGAALYQAVGRLPGIDVIGSRSDSLGRTGVAIGVADWIGIRRELIIDPKTGRLLGERQVLTREIDDNPAPANTTSGPPRNMRPGEVMADTTYVSEAVVDSVTARP